MALANRGELETEIAEWLDRSDLTARIPSFLRLCEAELNRKVRSPWNIKRCRGTTMQGFTELPERWLEAIRFSLPEINPGVTLVYKPPHEVQQMVDGCAPGDPMYYTLLGRTLQLAPTPADATVIEMVYVEQIQLDVASTSTNWLLERHPDVYLWGTLMQASAYLKHDERVSTWADRFANAMDELNMQHERATTSGSPLSRTARLA